MQCSSPHRAELQRWARDNEKSLMPEISRPPVHSPELYMAITHNLRVQRVSTIMVKPPE